MRRAIWSLVEGNHVCGQTCEGHVFRLTVITPDMDLKADVVVWEN